FALLPKKRLGTHFRTWASPYRHPSYKLDILTLYQTGIYYPILYLWRPAYTQPKLRIIIGPYPNRTEASRLSYSSTQENAYVPPADGVSTICSPIGFLPRRMAGCYRSSKSTMTHTARRAPAPRAPTRCAVTATSAPKSSMKCGPTSLSMVNQATSTKNPKARSCSYPVDSSGPPLHKRPAYSLPTLQRYIRSAREIRSNVRAILAQRLLFPAHLRRFALLRPSSK
ncbi:hypothetical protein B0T25DRAFT_53419, partial [Lasiosphaeria hispida]